VATQDLSDLKPQKRLQSLLVTFDDVEAPECFLPEHHRMRAHIQRSPNMNDTEGILGQTYGLTKALEPLGVDKTITLGIFTACRLTSKLYSLTYCC